MHHKSKKSTTPKSPTKTRRNLKDGAKCEDTVPLGTHRIISHHGVPNRTEKHFLAQPNKGALGMSNPRASEMEPDIKVLPGTHRYARAQNARLKIATNASHHHKDGMYYGLQPRNSQGAILQPKTCWNAYACRQTCSTQGKRHKNSLHHHHMDVSITFYP